MRHAKAALSLDLTDPRSWYCMGNASLAMYFHAGACDPKHLRSALKAYQNAVRALRLSLAHISGFGVGLGSGSGLGLRLGLGFGLGFGLGSGLVGWGEG